MVMSPDFLIEHINKFELAVPVRKLFGVNTSTLLMSSLRAVKVRQFMMDSISVQYVLNVLSLKR